MTQPAVISPQQRNQLRRTFRKDLKAPVKLRLFTQIPSPIAIPGRDCPTCAQAELLLQEVAGASPKIELLKHDFYADPETARNLKVERIPAILMGDDEPPRMKFYGIPLGHQMAVIVETIRSLSRGVSPLANDSRRKLRQVNRPTHLQIVVSPEDQTSAETAYKVLAATRENPNLSADAIQIKDYPSLARSLGVQSIPLVLINDLYRLAGPIAETELVDQILAAGVVQQPN